jgi:hypothetical protein
VQSDLAKIKIKNSKNTNTRFTLVGIPQHNYPGQLMTIP